MKKNYMAPEVEFLGLATSDVLCASTPQPEEPDYESYGTGDHGTEFVI